MKVQSKDVVALSGRLLLGGLFLTAGYAKFKNARRTEGYMKAKKVPAVSVLRPAAGALELFAGLSLISGYKPRVGAVSALLFLIPTSIIFHDFWNEEGEMQEKQMFNFLKNVAIMGGLAQLVAHGPGQIAIESGVADEELIPSLRAEIFQLRRVA